MNCSISITNIFVLAAHIFYRFWQTVDKRNHYAGHDYLCVFRSINQISNYLFKHLFDRLHITQLIFICINIYLYTLTFGTFILFQSSILLSSLCRGDTLSSTNLTWFQIYIASKLPTNGSFSNKFELHCTWTCHF